MATAALNVAGLATRLGIMTPIRTESLYLARVAIFGVKLLTTISSNLAILLALNSDSKHWM